MARHLRDREATPPEQLGTSAASGAPIRRSGLSGILDLNTVEDRSCQSMDRIPPPGGRRREGRKRRKNIYLPNETGMLDPELEQFDPPAKKTKRFFESNAAVLQGLKKAAENPSPALQKYRQKSK